MLLYDSKKNDNLLTVAMCISFIATFAAGLLLRTPWLSQTIVWAVLTPGIILAMYRTWRQPSVDHQYPICFWVVVGGLASFFLFLLLATAVAEFPQQRGLEEYALYAGFCLLVTAAGGILTRRAPEISALPFLRNRGVGNPLGPSPAGYDPSKRHAWRWSADRDRGHQLHPQFERSWGNLRNLLRHCRGALFQSGIHQV